MRVLLVINARVDSAILDDIKAGRSPRKDYVELQRALGADLLDLNVLDRRMWTRVIGRTLGASIAQAMLAWVYSRRYDAVFADRETTGFALAALWRLLPRRPRLVMIGHLLSPPKKQMVARALRLRDTIDCLVVHSSLQQRIAEEKLGLPPDQVALVPYQCDERFWTPINVPVKNQICTVGLEYRDYPTLVRAVEGLDVDIVIAAASHWSKHQAMTDDTLPPRIRVSSFGYEALRRLYAESRFVVVPLQDVDNQAGITVILEAMAMGKALVVSHTRGQVDVVRDRRHHNRADPERAGQSDWVRNLGATERVAAGETGIYVMPGDVAELRRAIVFLLEHPERANEMGANGRRVIEETMSLDHFTDRLTALITGEHGSARLQSAGVAGVDEQRSTSP